MATPKLDRETKKAILGARSKIEDVAKIDGNEAETRKRIDYIFGTVFTSALAKKQCSYRPESPQNYSFRTVSISDYRCHYFPRRYRGCYSAYFK